ncbi:endonuclease [Bergeyella zoohelcum]|uniref:Extracellular ribonuclease n=1 Tax=Bergeyella zoohelcum TaxID=1015 RepID=A0A380ZTF8_9FLAO|nr:endonuclease [Bergeyella zoohelcum]EKB59496.1 hypothetical protein HMPREF9700_01507 [Bergeyella zoohelcum CCUG 30536]SUV52623.1 Extracellular ribonuclease precursor [Bergeyella zoohelcum]
MIRKLLTLSGTFMFTFFLAQPPAHYYNGTQGLTGAQLKTQLHNIIKSGHITKSYGQLYTGYQTTDKDSFYENDNTVLDMYSENPSGTDPYNYTHSSGDRCGNYSQEGDCYNREHIIPQSLFGSATPMQSDIHFVRPSDGKVNGERGNLPFGVVNHPNYTSLNGSKRGTNATLGYSGTVFEPINEFKGDIARMIFYFVTRYQDRMNSFSTGNMLAQNTYPSLQDWQLQVLLAWHNQDPVSASEITRNNAAYTYQGNRNPYIDHPNWVNLVWNPNATVDNIPPTIPSNVTVSQPTANSLTLTWTASTDNVGVIGYDIYMNGTLHTTVSGTSNTTVISGLTPNTLYSFYIVAKDAAGNLSGNSSTATGTTLTGTTPTPQCTTTETFDAIPDNGTSYSTNTWTNHGIAWTATNSRTDQTINGKAITIRSGNLTSDIFSGGIRSITFKTQLKYTGTDGTLDVKVNGNTVGTINYHAGASASTHPVETWTIDNINIAGDVNITIANNTNNRVAIDDLSWECYTLSTSEVNAESSIVFYPNPVENGLLFIQGKDNENIKKIDVYSADGKWMKRIINPFKNQKYIDLQSLPSGVYLIVSEKFTKKIIVK